MLCPACASGRTGPTGLITSGRYELLHCAACGTQFYVDRGAGAEGVDGASHYWEAYKFEVYGDDDVRRGFEVRYRDVLDAAEREVGPLRSVLDVGAGIGNFCAFAEQRGMTALGSDVSPQAVAEARRRGLDVRLAEDVVRDLAPASVDALTMWDVVEHLIDPRAVLASVVPKVRPGGAVVFETPDGGFPVRRLLLSLHRYSGGRIDLTGPMYYWEHKIYFTERGLRDLLAGLGLRVVHVERATSVKEKMDKDFGARAQRGSLLGRLLKSCWPLLEAAFRRGGRGNKLLVVAVKG